MAPRLRVLLLVVSLVLVGVVLYAWILHRGGAAAGGDIALGYDVPDVIDEAPPASQSFTLDAFRPLHPSLFEVVAGIRAAADDDHVHALVLHVGEVEWGWGRLAEMREAIADFRAAGKPVYVSLQGGGNESCLLASRATRIAMPPTTTLGLDGLAISAVFLKGTYDKLGISPNFAHVGQFKSAVEQYTRSDLSPPARLALQSLLDDDYSLLVDSLAAARGTTPDRMRALIDDGPFTASDAQHAGLIDTLLDAPGLDSLAAGPERLPLVTLARYLDRLPEAGGPAEIAVVPASGAIVSGRSRDGGWAGAAVGSETLVRTLRELRERRSVRAVILRVDSPGGSGDASDDIWQEVRRLRRVKPVVVSMSNLAASGGYYIACGADAIVAEPATITGSIGVFGGKLNILGLYRKLGLNVETLSRGRHADMMSPYRDFTPEEAARYQQQLESFYRVFVSRVAQGRGLTTAEVDSIGQGRVWSGAAARRLGLVDTLGGLGLAASIARSRAHLEGLRAPLVLEPRPSRYDFRHFFSSVLDEGDDETKLTTLPPVVSAWLRAATFPTGVALAMLPYSIEIR
ncbi:MAG TPA: signal peptide peptidase SppA [Candidatus Acidoferrales bacterium]|nr:signal peptide peptidase SppA [Candidatus Acidoferrales bacterium]